MSSINASVNWHDVRRASVRPSFSGAEICDALGHRWKALKPPSGKSFERCLRCRAERGRLDPDDFPRVMSDDIAAARLVAAAKAGALAPDIAAGVLYLNRVRADQALVILQLQNVLGYVRRPSVRR